MKLFLLILLFSFAHAYPFIDYMVCNYWSKIKTNAITTIHTRTLFNLFIYNWFYKKQQTTFLKQFTPDFSYFYCEILDFCNDLLKK